MFSRATSYEVEKTLLAASAMVKNILLTEPPATLQFLLILMIDLHRGNGNELAVPIFQQVDALSSQLLSERHPLRLICAWLTSSRWTEIEDNMSECLKMISDQFENFVGSMHISTLMIRQYLNTFLCFEGKFCQEIFQHQWGECEVKLGESDYRTLLLRETLMNIYCLQGHFSEAEKTGAGSLSGCQSRNRHIGLGSQALTIRAICQHEHGDIDQAITTLQEFIKTRYSIFGLQDELAINDLRILEKWFIEQGELIAALEIYDQRVKQKQNDRF